MTQVQRILTSWIGLFSLVLIFIAFPQATSAAKHEINLYAWSGYIPDDVIQEFEKETDIRVNLTTYENNEVMYAKLKASMNAGYDVIIPSSYYIDRMRHENMLEPLDQSQLPNWKNINPDFMHLPFDPQSQYSIPFLWGTTGIVLNDQYHSEKNIKKWSDLWDKRFQNQLLVLDDTREVFSVALIMLGYNINDKNPDHLKQAYLKIKELIPNVKVFSTDTVISILIDEDATIGMAWNGDAYKASQENKHIKFIYPEEGFIIWVDNLAIPKNPPHPAEAHAFLNFLMRPDIAKRIALFTGFPTGDLAGQKLLPPSIRDNPSIYPPKAILKHGQFQTNLGDATMAIYEKYWEELKMSG